MPLIVVCGIPRSGKTRAANLIADFLTEEKRKKVELISEEALIETGDKNSVFADSRKEKVLRGQLKSEVIRVLNKDTTVILDGLNYIKGFRYELYCASKAAKTTQITVHCDLSPEDARAFNRGDDPVYSEHVFDGLVMRFEAPSDKNRWDSPLFLSIKGRELDLNAIFEALFDRKPPPPNQSTQNQPLSSTTFLHDLDKITSRVVKVILEAQKAADDSEEVRVEGETVKMPVSLRKVTMAELARNKRQFITYIKASNVNDVDKVIPMYVNYLNAHFVSNP